MIKTYTNLIVWDRYKPPNGDRRVLSHTHKLEKKHIQITHCLWVKDGWGAATLVDCILWEVAKKRFEFVELFLGKNSPFGRKQLQFCQKKLQFLFSTKECQTEKDFFNSYLLLSHVYVWTSFFQHQVNTAFYIFVRTFPQVCIKAKASM